MNNSKKRSRLEKYAPVGIDLKKEMIIFIASMVGAVGYSLGFVSEYVTAHNALYEVINKKKVLIEGAKMPAFENLIGNYFNGFWLLGIVMAGLLVYHYFYHYQDSKIIYLMKRLSKKWEMHKRCWMLPIAGCIIAGIVAVLLVAVYWGIYLGCTPAQCLPL